MASKHRYSYSQAFCLNGHYSEFPDFQFEGQEKPIVFPLCKLCQQ